MNFNIANRLNWLAALAMLAGFTLAGWKIASRPPTAEFAVPFRQAVSSVPLVSARPTAQPAQQPSPDGRFGLNAGFIPSAPGQAVHAASLVELRDGGLRAVWFSGSREGAGDVVIRTSVMNPETLAWSAESTLFDRQQVQQGLWRYVKKLGNPVIARAPDGTLWLWMVTVSLGGWAGSSVTWARSTDEGRTWSAPRRLVTSPFFNLSTLVKGAPFYYQNGQVGLPVYHEFITKSAEILRLDAQGQVLDKQRIPASQGNLQPVVLVSSPQRAQAYMRSGNAQAVMTSSTDDGGQTWTTTRPSHWPNPDSALAGVVTSSGQQWLALNPTNRRRETLALLQIPVGGSFDGASLWPVESSATPPGTLMSVSLYEQALHKELKQRGASDAQAQAYVASAKRQLCGADSCAQEFSYPFLLQSRDGYLHLLYTWHRSRIKHVRLDPLQALLPTITAPAVVPSHAATFH